MTTNTNLDLGHLKRYLATYGINEDHIAGDGMRVIVQGSNRNDGTNAVMLEVTTYALTAQGGRFFIGGSDNVVAKETRIVPMPVSFLAEVPA